MLGRVYRVKKRKKKERNETEHNKTKQLTAAQRENSQQGTVKLLLLLDSINDLHPAAFLLGHTSNSLCKSTSKSAKSTLTSKSIDTSNSW